MLLEHRVNTFDNDQTLVFVKSNSQLAWTNKIFDQDQNILNEYKTIAESSDYILSFFFLLF